MGLIFFPKDEEVTGITLFILTQQHVDNKEPYIISYDNLQAAKQQFNALMEDTFDDGEYFINFYKQEYVDRPNADPTIAIVAIYNSDQALADCGHNFDRWCEDAFVMPYEPNVQELQEAF